MVVNKRIIWNWEFLFLSIICLAFSYVVLVYSPSNFVKGTVLTALSFCLGYCIYCFFDTARVE